VNFGGSGASGTTMRSSLTVHIFGCWYDNTQPFGTAPKTHSTVSISTAADAFHSCENCGQVAGGTLSMYGHNWCDKSNCSSGTSSGLYSLETTPSVVGLRTPVTVASVVFFGFWTTISGTARGEIPDERGGTCQTYVPNVQFYFTSNRFRKY